jgi:hypothetical protein
MLTLEDKNSKAYILAEFVIVDLQWCISKDVNDLLTFKVSRDCNATLVFAVQVKSEETFRMARLCCFNMFLKLIFKICIFKSIYYSLITF